MYLKKKQKTCVHINTSIPIHHRGHSLSLFAFPFSDSKRFGFHYLQCVYLLQNIHEIISKLLTHILVKKNKLLTREHYLYTVLLVSGLIIYSQKLFPKVTQVNSLLFHPIYHPMLSYLRVIVRFICYHCILFSFSPHSE